MKGFLKNYGALVLVLAALLLGLLGGQYIYHQFQVLNDRLDRMSAASYRLEEKLSLTETKGLMRRHWVYYGEVDPEARTVRVYISLVPQFFDRDTQVSVVCNGETLPAPWDNGAYRVQLDAPLDASCKITALSVTRGDKVERAELNWELMDERSLTPDVTSGGSYPCGAEGGLAPPYGCDLDTGGTRGILLYTPSGDSVLSRGTME